MLTKKTHLLQRNTGLARHWSQDQSRGNLSIVFMMRKIDEQSTPKVGRYETITESHIRLSSHNTIL